MVGTRAGRRDQADSRRLLFIIAAIIGTAIPWYFFAAYFTGPNVSLSGAASALFVNGAAGGFVADVLVSIGVFSFWAWYDAGQNSVPKWWLIFPALFFVGLSLAMPLYFFLRKGKMHRKEARSDVPITRFEQV